MITYQSLCLCLDVVDEVINHINLFRKSNKHHINLSLWSIFMFGKTSLLKLKS